LNQILKDEKDTIILNYFLKNGLKIENYTTMLSKCDFGNDYIINFVRKFPKDTNSINFLRDIQNDSTMKIPF